MGGRDSEPPPTLPDLLGAGAFILHASLPLRSCSTIMAPPVQGASQYGTSCTGGLPIWHLLRRGPPNMAPPAQGASQYGTSCAGGLPIWHLLCRGPPNMAPPVQGASHSQYGTSCAGGLPMSSFRSWSEVEVEATSSGLPGRRITTVLCCYIHR